VNLTPESAQMLLHLYCADAENEAKTTGRVLTAMPAGQESYKPSEKSMNAIDLAWHIASTDIWFLDSVAAGNFGWEDKPRPESLKTGADIAAWYATNFAAGMEKVRKISGDDALKVVDFMGAFQFPNVFYINFLIKHSVHHRGQLSVYLRPMGGKVPSIYGGSADEPFEMAAST
jgi:uncharacterized damage-inducible protein DinB